MGWENSAAAEVKHWASARKRVIGALASVRARRGLQLRSPISSPPVGPFQFQPGLCLRAQPVSLRTAAKAVQCIADLLALLAVQSAAYGAALAAAARTATDGNVFNGQLPNPAVKRRRGADNVVDSSRKLASSFGDSRSTCVKLLDKALSSSDCAVGATMLTKEIIVQQLREKYPYLTSEYGVKRIGLFGSFATGTADEASDIDVIVEFQRPVASSLSNL